VRIGPPDFHLDPPTIGPDTPVDPSDPRFADVAPELAVAGCLMRCLDLGDPNIRLMVVQLIAGVDEGRRPTYTCYVRLAASDAARSALEDLMAARGLVLSGEQRDRVLSCADLSR
jgi:hypothetical protein